MFIYAVLQMSYVTRITVADLPVEDLCSAKLLIYDHRPLLHQQLMHMYYFKEHQSPFEKGLKFKHRG